MDNYQYRAEDEKGRYKQPEVKDFRRLNKVVLKEGATNAAVSSIVLESSGLTELVCNDYRRPEHCGTSTTLKFLRNLKEIPCSNAVLLFRWPKMHALASQTDPRRPSTAS